MKKVYETPTVEMIAFRYRDQVVAASAGGEGTGDSGNTGNPSVGGLYGPDSWGGNCKYYVAEALGWSVCTYA